ncbi:MBL fold metallo-hydrolase [Oerskovia flava]|uniref:MBL fold metallo-hydrolase n=1 Tax=Oerskovia flava TaxID=2986422 RepID=UPI0022404808|nr:MBL fold metallo-hydrolase [Oerskovia sp. JB1-3-2]
MQIYTVVAPVFGTNCYVAAADGPMGEQGDRDCVVVDAGAGVAPAVRDLLTDQRLVPRAVLATHGHVDHTWDAAALCAHYDVPMYLHAADAYRLDDPFGTIEPGVTRGAGDSHVSGPLGQALRAAGARPEDYRVPTDVRAVDAGDGGEAAVLDTGAVRLGVLHAPGHTQGSVLYLVGRPGDGAVLTGDVLFAGTIGRTDLPGGDGATMSRTLRDVVGRLDDGWMVLPGHGPATDMRRERRTNPFLAGA